MGSCISQPEETSTVPPPQNVPIPKEIPIQPPPNTETINYFSLGEVEKNLKELKEMELLAEGKDCYHSIILKWTYKVFCKTNFKWRNDFRLVDHFEEFVDKETLFLYLMDDNHGRTKKDCWVGIYVKQLQNLKSILEKNVSDKELPAFQKTLSIFGLDLPNYSEKSI